MKRRENKIPRCLVHFDVFVNVAYKVKGSPKSHGAQGQEEGVTGEQGPRKEFDRLQQSGHVGTAEEVEQRVKEYEGAGGSGGEERAPPPLVIFSGQLKVSQRDGYSRRDAQKNEERQAQNPIQSVRLSTP